MSTKTFYSLTDEACKNDSLEGKRQLNIDDELITKLLLTNILMFSQSNEAEDEVISLNQRSAVMLS